MADLPKWLKEFKENLVDTEMPASAHGSQELDLEHPTKSGNDIKEAQCLYSLPKRPKLRRLEN